MRRLALTAAMASHSPSDERRFMSRPAVVPPYAWQSFTPVWGSNRIGSAEFTRIAVGSAAWSSFWCSISGLGAPRTERVGRGDGRPDGRGGEHRLPEHRGQVVPRDGRRGRELAGEAKMERPLHGVERVAIGALLDLVHPSVVGGRRLEVGDVGLAGVRDAGDHRVQDPEVEALPPGAGQLGRGEDGRVQADPPAVEEPLRGAVLVAHRLEEVQPLGEEGALLREEELLVADVEHHLVGLDLSEVGIERGDERQVGGERGPQVKPHVRRRVAQPGLGRRGVGVLRPEGQPGGGVGRELERAPRHDSLQPGERPEARDEPVGAARDELRVEDLVGPVHGAPDEEAPLLRGRAGEAQELQRNGELDAPAVRELRHRGVPHPVPGVGSG